MELTAIEIDQRISQEGSIDYVLMHYFSAKDLNKIKDKELKQITIELLHNLEEFLDVLEDVKFKELTRE
jgi:hypothetical protein